MAPRFAYRRPGWLAAILVLAACAETPPDGGSVAASTAAAHGSRSGLAAAAGAAGTSRDTEIRPYRPPLPRATLLASRPAAERLSPEALVGLGPHEVTSRLGLPRLQRRDPPAEVWQYVSESCVLFIFLYETTSHGDWQVHYVEARRRDQPDQVVRSDACIGGMTDRLPPAIDG